jgi:hypothetical protein
MEAVMKIALVLAALLAPAAAFAASGDACFRTRDITAHRKADDHTLNLKVGVKDVYRLTTKSSCLVGMSPSDALVVQAPPSGLVCKAIDLDLAIRQSGAGAVGATPCLVDSIVKLTPAQVAALPKGQRP